MRDSQSRSPTRSALAREWHPHSEASLLSSLLWCDPVRLRDPTRGGSVIYAAIPEQL